AVLLMLSGQTVSRMSIRDDGSGDSLAVMPSDPLWHAVVSVGGRFGGRWNDYRDCYSHEDRAEFDKALERLGVQREFSRELAKQDIADALLHNCPVRAPTATPKEMLRWAEHQAATLLKRHAHAVFALAEKLLEFGTMEYYQISRACRLSPHLHQ